MSDPLYEIYREWPAAIRGRFHCKSSPPAISCMLFLVIFVLRSEISNHQPEMRRGNKEIRIGARRLYANLNNSAELFSSWPGIEVIQKYWDEYSDHKDELLIKLAGLSMFKSPGLVRENRH